MIPVASIGFDYGPFHAFISSHGHYGIAASDLPWAVVGPLPGLLEHGRAEALNETWDSEGREPDRLIGTDDDMPDLADPRLERCLKAYVERHWATLQRRHEKAKRRWEEMQQQTVVVNGVSLRPGQRVRLYSHWEAKVDEFIFHLYDPPGRAGEFIFHAIDDEGCVYLGGENGFRSQKLGPMDRLIPLDSD